MTSAAYTAIGRSYSNFAGDSSLGRALVDKIADQNLDVID